MALQRTLALQLQLYHIFIMLSTKLGTGRIHRLYLNRGSFNAILRPKYLHRT